MISEMLPTQTNVEAWFDNLVAEIRSQQVQIETGLATEQMANLYNTMIAGNTDNMAYLGKAMSQQHFVARILFDYLILVKKDMPNKLAVYYNDSEVLVWAEINSENSSETKERELLKAEAIINAKYHPFGFDMESTIVENADSLPIPNHYKLIKG